MAALEPSNTATVHRHITSHNIQPLILTVEPLIHPIEPLIRPVEPLIYPRVLTIEPPIETLLHPREITPEEPAGTGHHRRQNPKLHSLQDQLLPASYSATATG